MMFVVYEKNPVAKAWSPLCAWRTAAQADTFANQRRLDWHGFEYKWEKADAF